LAFAILCLPSWDSYQDRSPVTTRPFHILGHPTQIAGCLRIGMKGIMFQICELADPLSVEGQNSIEKNEDLKHTASKPN